MKDFLTAPVETKRANTLQIGEIFRLAGSFTPRVVFMLRDSSFVCYPYRKQGGEGKAYAYKSRESEMLIGISSNHMVEVFGIDERLKA